MKKILSILLVMMFTVTSFVGCKSGEEQTALKINHEILSMTLFGETDLVVEGGNADELTWENSAENVVKMQPLGESARLIAVGSGTSVITAKQGKQSVSCTVSVAQSTQKLALTTEVEGQLKLRLNGTASVPASVKFDGVDFNKATITYSVDDQNVATVSTDGMVTAKAVGTTTLTVSAEYLGVTSNVKSIDIIVTDGPILKTNASYIYLYATEAGDNTVIYPNRFNLEVSILDGETEVKDFAYEVVGTDDTVAVLTDGTIETKKVGSTVITVSYTYKGQLYTAKINVQVDKVPEVEITLTEKDIRLFSSAPSTKYHSAKQISAIVTVDGRRVSSESVVWKVIEGADVASVSQRGVVKYLKSGVAKVSANFTYGGNTYTDICNVEVTSPLEYVESARLYNREGIYATVCDGMQLVYDEITLENDQNKTFINFNMIPDKLLKNTYTGNMAPIEPDSKKHANIGMIYITLMEIGNESNSVTVGIKYTAGDFSSNITGARIGALTSAFPAYRGKSGMPFYGFSGIDKDTGKIKDSSAVGKGGGWGLGTTFSFFGHYLSDTTDKYTLGLSIEGTTLYAHNNGNVEKIWDLKEDTLKFAQDYPDGKLPASYAWNGFTSNKVKMIISGDYYDNDWFNMMILDVAGHKASANDLDKMSIIPLV